MKLVRIFYGLTKRGEIFSSFALKIAKKSLYFSPILAILTDLEVIFGNKLGCFFIEITRKAGFLVRTESFRYVSCEFLEGKFRKCLME